MNTTTRFFQTKDQYLAFRNAFAAAQNDKACRKTYTESTGTRWNSTTKANETYTYKTKHSGWLSSEHYLLFNLVTGKNYYNGFSPKTKKLFVESGGDADRGLNGAIDALATLIGYAGTLTGLNVEPQAPSWIKDKKQFVVEKMASYQAYINTFLQPFGGVFTLQDLARVQLPSFPGLTNEQKEEFKGKPLTYGQLFGEQITDQTPDEEEEPIQIAVAADFGIKEPQPEKKKGLLARIFS